jgi:Rrf2 family protein
VPGLSHTTGYAIEALACLARAEAQTMRVAEVAECSGIPAPYLAKIFQRLAEAGIVTSKRGHKGGVSLVWKPDELSLLHIDASIDASRACPQYKLPEESPRPTTFWEAFLHSYREKLASMTLAEVLTFEAIPETSIT